MPAIFRDTNKVWSSHVQMLETESDIDLYFPMRRPFGFHRNGCQKAYQLNSTNQTIPKFSKKKKANEICISNLRYSVAASGKTEHRNNTS